MAEISTLGPVVLLDIEGTTTPIDFVKGVLFPYARDSLSNFLLDSWDDPEVQDVVNQIAAQAEIDVQNGLPNVPKVLNNPTDPLESRIVSIMKNVIWQMDQDRKTTGLKALQGKIWEVGYSDKILKSQVFPDVPVAMERWASDKKIYIYSSGSIEAQKLLFENTEYGNLSSYVSGYFDTTTGPKTDPQSYVKIATDIKEPPENITFFTDILEEANAAKAAGMRVVVMVRPGNQALPEHESHEYTIARDFDKFH